MSTLSLNLPEADAKKLAEMARREGLTPEQVAAAAVRARLDADESARREVEAGLAELDAGEGLDIADYEREMDLFMASLQSKRG